MLKGYNFDLAARFVSDYKLPVSIISDVNVFEYELNQILEVLLKELNNFAQMVFVDTAVSDNLTTKTILEKLSLRDRTQLAIFYYKKQ